ncbi:hypothetical protein [Radiobacillus deserti]|uniref:Uncharacterized protein n=1 Tax=Radiobacillus deserti TaxID=2594883 RepID=A0A516KIA7_9BACI|nr:hypothetical protein [Radiobacillus deserti]QDP41130.1 hypothetical protein FN924_13585 [Radiobacillus deserti]
MNKSIAIVSFFLFFSVLVGCTDESMEIVVPDEEETIQDDNHIKAIKNLLSNLEYLTREKLIRHPTYGRIQIRIGIYDFLFIGRITSFQEKQALLRKNEDTFLLANRRQLEKHEIRRNLLK